MTMENTKEAIPPFAEAHGSEDDIVMELKLPVPVKELAAVTDALCKIHGKNTLFMRQVGPMLQLYKPRAASPPNAEVSDRRAHGNENTTGANGGALH